MAQLLDSSHHYEEEMILEEDRATIVLSTAIKAARELGDLVHVLDAVDAELKVAISTAVYEIMQNIVSPLMDDFPSLKEAIEGRIEKYGRAF